MAAILRHSVCRSYCTIELTTVTFREYATKAEKKKGLDRKQGPTINSSAKSLAAKGFLRPQKDYTPPQDAEQRLHEICENVLGKYNDDETLSNLNQKSLLLSACYKSFRHCVPNSLLRCVNTIKDVKNFYRTPIETSTPLEKMKTMELPENLHIQYDYVRFHPDSDTKFGGQTAFNGRSTIVTGLKYKDKYPGHTQDAQWPVTN